MVSTQANFRFGTAGWSYADWQGVVYPQPQPAGFSPLKFLAEDFDFVEVNTTFYRVPSQRLAQGWVRQVRDRDHFTFWVKLNQAFTHQTHGDEHLASAFKNAVQPLKESDRLAGILAQFPYSFHYQQDNLDRLKRLREWFGQIPLAIEFRHRSWHRDTVLTFLREHRMCWTNIDQPSISSSLPLTSLSSGCGSEYLRLHGRNASEWFSGAGRNARYDYNYSHTELEEIAAAAMRIGQKSSGPVFISGNNHYKGQAVRNLKSLKQIIEGMLSGSG